MAFSFGFEGEISPFSWIVIITYSQKPALPKPGRTGYPAPSVLEWATRPSFILAAARPDCDEAEGSIRKVVMIVPGEDGGAAVTQQRNDNAIVG